MIEAGEKARLIPVGQPCYLAMSLVVTAAFGFPASSATAAALAATEPSADSTRQFRQLQRYATVSQFDVRCVAGGKPERGEAARGVIAHRRPSLSRRLFESRLAERSDAACCPRASMLAAAANIGEFDTAAIYRNDRCAVSRRRPSSRRIACRFGRASFQRGDHLPSAAWYW